MYKALGFGQQRLAEPAALQRRIHRKHPEVPGAVVIGNMRTGHQTLILFDHQHQAAFAQDIVAQHGRIDTRTLENIGLGGPAHAAAVAAIGRSHQQDESVDVSDGSGAESDGLHGDSLIGNGECGMGEALRCSMSRVPYIACHRRSGEPLFRFSIPDSRFPSAQQSTHLHQRGDEALDFVVRVVERQ